MLPLFLVVKRQELQRKPALGLEFEDFVSEGFELGKLSDRPLTSLSCISEETSQVVPGTFVECAQTNLLASVVNLSLQYLQTAEVLSVGHYEVPLSPSGVVLHVFLNQFLCKAEFVVPQTEALDDPLAIAPGVNVLGVIFEHAIYEL